MKRLHEKVNIIPLIAKADTLTPEECQQFKKQVSLIIFANVGQTSFGPDFTFFYQLRLYYRFTTPSSPIGQIKTKVTSHLHESACHVKPPMWHSLTSPKQQW